MTKANSQHAVKLKPNVQLITKIDAFAEGLLADTATGSVEERQDVLGAVTKWIATRHKLQESEGEDGAGLAGYRSAIASPNAERAAAARSRNVAASRAVIAAEGDAIGADLQAIRDRLPTADAGRPAYDLADLGRKIHSAPGGLRGVSLGLPRSQQPGSDEDDRARRLQPDGTWAAGMADRNSKLGE